MELWPSYDRRFRLGRSRGTSLICPLATLSNCMHVVVVFLGQGITNKLIVRGTPRISHGLHQFGTQTPFEALYLFLLSIHKTWSISGQVVECVHILCEGLCSLSEPHKFGCFHAHQAQGNMVSPKSQLELFPGNSRISRQGRQEMCPPDPCWSLQLMRSILYFQMLRDPQ